MRVPPSQSLTRCAAAFSACSRRFSRSGRVTRVRRVPKVKTSAVPTACTSACASSCSPRCGLSSSRRRRSGAAACAAACRRSQPSEPQHLAVVADAVTQGAAQVRQTGPRRARIRRWPRRRGSRAGASRMSRRSGVAGSWHGRSAARPAPRRAPRRARIRWLRRPEAARPRRGLPPASRTSLLVLALGVLDGSRCRGNAGRTACRRSRAAPAAAPAWQARPAGCVRGCAARATSMAARKAVVCSGATAKPLARSSATKETKMLRRSR